MYWHDLNETFDSHQSDSSMARPLDIEPSFPFSLGGPLRGVTSRLTYVASKPFLRCLFLAVRRRNESRCCGLEIVVIFNWVHGLEERKELVRQVQISNRVSHCVLRESVKAMGAKRLEYHFVILSPGIALRKPYIERIGIFSAGSGSLKPC